MINILTRGLKDKKRSLITYTVISILLLWMYVAMFPSIQEYSTQFEEMFQNYPEEFTKAFGLEEMGFSTLEEFLAIEQFSLIWPALVIFLMISVAGTVTKEMEEGTIEVVLSKPISRTNFILGRFLLGVFMLLIFVLFSIFSVIPLGEMHGMDYQLYNHIGTALLGFLFGLSVLSLALLLSTVFSERGKLYLSMGGAMLGMYVIKVVSLLKENLSELKYASFFHYFDSNKVMADGEISLISVIVFLSVSLVCVGLALLVFNKRDIPAK